MNTRSQLSELFTPIYDEFMLMGFAEEKQVGPQIFTIKDDLTKEWKFDGISGTGEWTAATELSSGGYEDLVLGYPKTITPLKYWKKILVSFEANDQDEYAKLKGRAKDGNPSALGIGKGGNVKVERLMAAQIYGGFTTAGPDGQYLYDTDHPKNREETGITYDNLLVGPLSHDNLELAEKKISDNLYDMKGLPIPVFDNPILLYPPALKGKAKRLLSDRADYIPEISAVNSEMAINQFAGQYNPIMWRLLSAKEGGSDTAWYIIYKDAEALRGIYGRRPSFDNWIDKDIEAYVFKGSLMFASGPVFHNGLFASTGL